MTQQQYNFHNLYTRFDDQFTPPLPSHVNIHIPDAEQRLRAGLDYFVRQFSTVRSSIFAYACCVVLMFECPRTFATISIGNP